MGMGFKKGKKTAKAIDSELTQFQNAVRQALMMLQVQVAQLGQRAQSSERMLELIDYRSLATLKVLLDRSVFTNEEHERMAETQRIISFNEQSEADNATRGLTPAVDGDTVDEGFVYVARVDAFEPASSPKAGQKIEQLSMLRMKIAYGSGEFPKAFEEKFKATKPGETLNFTLACPKELGSFAGKDVDFKVEVLQLFKVPAEKVASEVEERLPDVPIEDAPAPRLSVVEKLN